MHAMSTTRTVLAGGLAAIALSASATQASAAPYGAGVFSLGGGAISTVEEDGDVVFTGPGLVTDRRLQEMRDVTLTVVVSPQDGELPAVGSCTPATSTFVAEGKRGLNMTLDGAGEVCARAVNPSFTETVFQGTFAVIEADRRDLRGVTGDYRVNIKPNGFTRAHAASSVA